MNMHCSPLDRARTFSVLCIFLILFTAQAFSAPAPEPTPAPVNPDLAFINTAFENASPVWYEIAPDGTINVNLLYDHERDSPNRAAGHIHIQLQGTPGTSFTLEFKNLDNIYNGRPGSVGKELKSVAISENGRDWQFMHTEVSPDNRVRLKLRMPGPSLYIARIEPYRLSDLDRLIDSIRGNPLVKITVFGKTVEGRDLEIVRLGNPDAPCRVFLRARAHPWESGGNWVVQGLIRRLLEGDAEAKKFLDRYCVYINPMANKDGVARGRTRFNMNGKDLNRDWSKPADPVQAPENAALEKWLGEMIAKGQAPHLALEMHNDGGGRLHVSRPPTPNADTYLEHMGIFEKLLNQHSWFREGMTPPTFSNTGTLGQGWVERFGIDAAVHELNANWVAGLNDFPSGKNWETYGASLARVFYEYFDQVKPNK